MGLPYKAEGDVPGYLIWIPGLHGLHLMAKFNKFTRTDWPNPRQMINRSTPLILLVLIMISLLACSKQVPVPSFSVDKVDIVPGETVNFTDQSINEPTSWEWTFTGGTPQSSNMQHPSVTYNEAGDYEVSLIASNGDGSSMISKDHFIRVHNPAPVVAFSADRTTLDAGGSVNFTDLSSNNPDEWSWVFPGGDPSESTTRNPSIQYSVPGTYPVSLYVANASGSDWLTKEDYITVNQVGTSITFFNSTYTDIHIELNGIEKVIPPDGDVTYYELTASYVDYTAWTSGMTSEGAQVGYRLSWENTIELTFSQMSRTLVVGSSYYCLFIKNNGTESLNPLDVGIMDTFFDFYADRTEDILLPNDNENYRIGYYESFEATEYNWIQIRAYKTEGYVYWSQGVQFNLPDTTNQSIHLYSEIKKKAAESSWKDPGNPENFLYPDRAIRLQKLP